MNDLNNLNNDNINNNSNSKNKNKNKIITKIISKKYIKKPYDDFNLIKTYKTSILKIIFNKYNNNNNKMFILFNSFVKKLFVM